MKLEIDTEEFTLNGGLTIFEFVAQRVGHPVVIKSTVVNKTTHKLIVEYEEVEHHG